MSPPIDKTQKNAWNDFSVAKSANDISGAQASEGRETYGKLSAAVKAGTLSSADQLLLATSAATPSVMGETQALRAVDKLKALSAAEAAAFKQIADKAASPLERAFIFKGLATGQGVAALGAFATAIHGWENAELLETLNLADPILADGKQTGVKQQFAESCGPTTAQALHAQVDPMYALLVRKQNPKLHEDDDSDGLKMNPKLAAEQEAMLKTLGSSVSSRNDKVIRPGPKGSTGPTADTIVKVYNQLSAETGFTFVNKDFPYFGSGKLDAKDVKIIDTALNAIVGQLQRGIYTPLAVGPGDLATETHAMLALSVQGSGAKQTFTIHDPWSGNTLSVTRAQFEADAANMDGKMFEALGGYGVATLTR